MQVYVLVYFHSGEVKDGLQFLVTKKRELGYFFEGALVPKGKKLNSAGAYVLPGGKHEVSDQGKDLTGDGVREFLEETGYDLAYAKSEMFLTTRGKSHAFATLQVESLDKLKAIKQAIDPCLVEGNQAAAKVKDRTVDTWEDLKNSYPLCPTSNELESVDLWDSRLQRAEVMAWKNSTATDWFHNFMIKEFAQFFTQQK
ncbi:hypothetical protein [Plantactinospora sp. WMMB782]|uniref:hypothetical protein n=1 Tax=Plantactinospora sp. WMMB782 TaxID=3404121 RepID=UPI003B922E42